MSRKVGRNAPCPCGSGKKFKKCCLRKGSSPANSPGSLSEVEVPSTLSSGPSDALIQTPEPEKKRPEPVAVEDDGLDEGGMPAADLAGAPERFIASELERLAAQADYYFPSNAGKLILSSLKDSESPLSDKLIAAELASDLAVMNDETADALLAIILDGEADEELRGTAAISLGPVLEEIDFDGYSDFEEPTISDATHARIQETLKKVYFDGAAPVLVRRRALEASIRERRDWHQGAVAAAWATGDQDWRSTAVFAMGWLPGFEDQILEALKSDDEQLLSEAVIAAGQREIKAAWPVVTGLLRSRDTDKDLLIAAIEAACSIRPKEAGSALSEVLRSQDEDIVEVAEEALAMSQALSGELWDDEDGFI